MKNEDSLDSEEEDADFNQSQSNPEEDSHSEGSRKQNKKEKKSKKGRDKKRLHKDVMRFIDRDAEDADEDSAEIQGNKEDQYYQADALVRKNQRLDLDELEKKHEKRARYEEERERLRQLGKEISPPESDDDYYSQDSDGEHVGIIDDKVRKQQILPSIDDPKIWQVRVKKNFEKIAVMALLNKSIDFASKGRPLSILSATCSESTEGWIYVEAFKEVHIKQACQNLHFCFNKYILLPQE